MYTLTVEVGEGGAEVDAEIATLDELRDLLFGKPGGAEEGLQWDKITKVTITPATACKLITDDFAPDWCATHGRFMKDCIVEGLMSLPQAPERKS